MNKKQRVTITLDKELFKKFKDECNNEDIKISTKINSLIRDWLIRRGL